ncbi:MAG: HNH endonuclease signature motif containing protein [Azonexus sp.]
MPPLGPRQSAGRVPARVPRPPSTRSERRSDYYPERRGVSVSECVESSRTPSRVYPQIKVAGRQRPESNVTWEQANGPIPDGLLVLHRCDNPRCVNLEHLFLGDHGDNARDRESKGRGRGGWTTCAKGHPFTPENTYIRPDNGRRHCVECRRRTDSVRVRPT